MKTCQETALVIIAAALMAVGFIIMITSGSDETFDKAVEQAVQKIDKRLE